MLKMFECVNTNMFYVLSFVIIKLSQQLICRFYISRLDHTQYNVVIAQFDESTMRELELRNGMENESRAFSHDN